MTSPVTDQPARRAAMPTTSKINVAPFPKGAPTAPELLVPDEALSVDAIRSELVSLMERIGTGPREGAGPVHPLLGRLSFREWGVATYKHTDHHLRQFSR